MSLPCKVPRGNPGGLPTKNKPVIRSAEACSFSCHCVSAGKAFSSQQSFFFLFLSLSALLTSVQCSRLQYLDSQYTSNALCAQMINWSSSERKVSDVIPDPALNLSMGEKLNPQIHSDAMLSACESVNG